LKFLRRKRKNKIPTPVFYDPQNRRWKVSLLFFTVLTGFFVTIFTILFLSIYRDTNLPDVSTNESSNIVLPLIQERQFISDTLTAPTSQVEDIDGYVVNLPSYGDSEGEIQGVQTKESEIHAFLVNWDNNSFYSLRENLNHIDVLMPEWVHIDNSDGDIALNDRGLQIEMQNYVEENKPELKIIPVINNYDQTEKRWNPDLVLSVIENDGTRENLINSLYEYITSNGFTGINIDFEEIPQEEQADLQMFMRELKAKFDSTNLVVTQSLPIDNDSIDYSGALEHVDYLVLLAYDEHWATSVPGPLASHNWFSKAVYDKFKTLDPNKIVIGLGSYGYEWEENDPSAEPISFQEMMGIIERSGGSLGFEEESLSSFYKYTDTNDILHEIWFQDSVSIFNQIKVSSQVKPRGYALWRLGSEDPSVWKVFNERNNLTKETAVRLTSIPTGYGIDYVGEGEILRIQSSPKMGTRRITYSENLGIILNQEIKSFSTPYVIERVGNGGNRKIALTFDDGPNNQYTVQILEILKEKGIKATFFVVGAEIENHPNVLRRVVEEGHEVGNHTFTHPDISKVSEEQLRLELNATQKLAESIIGRNLILFRAPYGRDVEPRTYKEIKPLETVNELGYYSVIMKIDPKDYDPKKPADEIALTTLEHIDQGLGNVILLHDGGGNRSNTVEALPEIIDDLQKSGYEFVLVSELMGLEREDVMPISPTAAVGAASIINHNNINKIGFTLISLFTNFLTMFLAIGLIIGIIRLISIVILAIIQKVRKDRGGPIKLKHHPKVSVIIPAFNEGVVILKSIKTALDSDYPNFDVIVVDDGSSDNTYEIANGKYGKNPKVKVLGYKDNRGKSSAINFALDNSDSKYVIILDADTLLHQDAIFHLITRVKDRNVGAVAGNVKVGNRGNMLAKFQALEYITSQNLERRAADLIDSITIVPGAIGIWQRGLVKRAGGFNSLTLAEDSEVTLRIHKLGYRVCYEEKAIGYTEAPESFSSFKKQRFRWMFGRLQIIRMHWDMLMNPKYGFVGMYALPTVFLFQIVFTFLAPLFDLVFVLTVISNTLEYYYHPETANFSFPVMLAPYILFLFVDLIVATIALLMERDEDFKLVFWVPLQRIVFRWSYYFISYKAFLTAIKGPKVDWGKFERTATVGLPNN
jgi:cellulose synthase/poly-beta-1,6-N-acetylglucosamine synthase-like glycosyltransferase/peptidoglycan/xylan/chitin deacetylase (PgdA/CDA1 family)/spore germination protein YaaH